MPWERVAISLQCLHHTELYRTVFKGSIGSEQKSEPLGFRSHAFLRQLVPIQRTFQERGKLKWTAKGKHETRNAPLSFRETIPESSFRGGFQGPNFQ